MENLADRIRTVLNSGPFGLEVSHSGIRGHQPIYRVICYSYGMPSTDWVMETEDGTAVLLDLLSDMGAVGLADAVYQGMIYHALCLELESVLSESAAVNYGTSTPVTNETLIALLQEHCKGGK